VAAILAGCFAAALAGCMGQSTQTQNSNGDSNTPPASQPGARTQPRASDQKRNYPLDTLPTAVIRVNNHDLRVWLAITSDHQAEGLMHVPAEEIADDQGMLLVFSDEDLRFFWMKNTITALDIAYARMDGTVVTTWTMPPLTLKNFPSVEPAMFALEMKAGAFERLGIAPGSKIVIPDDVFKASR
jgi:uncharacterized membrane protein (UPF0127 family)